MHHHPDSIMITQSAFRRRLGASDREMDVKIPSGAVRWVGAQMHYGVNIGETETHWIFVELKDTAEGAASDSPLGPSEG